MTVIEFGPSVAFEAMISVVLMVVLLTSMVFVAVMPAGVLTVSGAEKLPPFSITFITVVPVCPELGAIAVNVGTGLAFKLKTTRFPGLPEPEALPSKFETMM